MTVVFLVGSFVDFRVHRTELLLYTQKWVLEVQLFIINDKNIEAPVVCLKKKEYLKCR